MSSVFSGSNVVSKGVNKASAAVSTTAHLPPTSSNVSQNSDRQNLQIADYTTHLFISKDQQAASKQTIITMISSPNRVLVCIGAALASSFLFHNGRFAPNVHAFTSFHGHSRQSLSSSSPSTTSFSPLHVSSVSSSSAFSDDGPSFEDHNMVDRISRRKTEFTDLGSLETSMERQRRIQQEERNEQRFVKYGDDLWALRKLMNKLSHKLLQAINTGLRDKEGEIREQLRQIEQQDPECVYKMELEQLKVAKMEGRDADARKHSRNAYAARSCLPQFNLEGLWVGK
jgi:hypothetical protein